MSVKFLTFLPLLMGAVEACAQVVNIEEQRITGTRDSVHWYGHLRGGANVIKVRQQSLQLQGQAKVQYKNDPNLVLLLLNVNLLRAGNSDFARQAFAHLRYNRKWAEVLTWEAFAQTQTSPIQLLDQRHLFGTGLRWRLMKSKDGRQRIYLGTAWLWEQNYFTEPFGVSAWHRSSNYLSSTFRLSSQAMLIQTTYWQPVIGRVENYRLSTEWLLKVNLGKHLALTIEYDYGVDKNLPETAPRETYAWRNGLMWQW
jgi:putative salt-induced outer membrane protein YdiY